MFRWTTVLIVSLAMAGCADSGTRDAVQNAAEGMERAIILMKDMKDFDLPW